MLRFVIQMGKGLLAIGLLLLTACATTPPLDSSGIDTALTPAQAGNDPAGLKGSRVLWGGMIIAAENLETQTQIEILAYPLDTKQRPDTSAQPYGRFLARRDGYLETADLDNGRLITLTGRLEGTTQAMIGESRYTYPVVQVSEYHLWRRGDEASGSQVHFGLGVILHN
jgi:outer membrane lipoprotein